ncbi:sugar ABC transporter permease [Cohnella ginsengisoli]|uniref:Sugar ABC transporter permease n=1 Tax=Cohnella ginsengisoli TaxID=425004 RepID=A0A9X4QNI2_9BACL|nr:sugar ABC transporter permease [Cohnella ginsengisoli]MDG0792621.1 sugar ABC transporter permease [Cohnella ginsengisoli]
MRSRKLGNSGALIKPYVYIAPAVLLLLLFVYYPFAKTMVLSLSLTSPAGGFVKWNGMSNYTSMFVSPDFYDMLLVTFKFSIAVLTGSLVAGFFMALLVNSDRRGYTIFKTVYTLPMAVSSAAIAVVFSFVLHPVNGLLNEALGTDINWLNSPKWAMAAVIMVTVWQNASLNYIILLAALKGVDRSLYEAAEVDGAGYWKKQWMVSLPGVSPTLFFLVIVNAIVAFQAFAQIHVLTAGGPYNSTGIISYNIYLDALRKSHFGLAYAQSVFLFVVILAITRIQFYMEKKVSY